MLTLTHLGGFGSGGDNGARRYWRLIAASSAHHPSSPGRFALAGMRFYGTPGATGTPLVPVSVTALTSAGSNTPDKAVDGFNGTFWDTGEWGAIRPGSPWISGRR